MRPGEDPAFDWFAAVSPEGEGEGTSEDGIPANPEETAIVDRMLEQKLEEVERRRNAARLALLCIGLLIIGIVAVQLFRPPRAAEEEIEEEEAGEGLGGIPDPRAGLTNLPSNWLPKDPGERILVSYHRLQESLVDVRRHRRAAETPREHGARQTERFPDREPEFEALCRLVYAALYSATPVTEEDAIEADRLCQKLRSALK